MEEKQTVYSGIQATGLMTLGNYIGAISNWVKLQEDYNSIFSIVDLHSLTVRQVPEELRKRSLSFFAQYLACGIDPSKSIIYFQSHVPEHCELQWILNCFTYVGEMNRMTQYKEKCLKHSDNVNMGLMDYPVLMAADILLYQTSLVPIGVDQRQHLEIARDIAMRFNNLYSPTFVVPEAYYGKQGAKIYSLQNPTAKMSKSDVDNNATISIIDTPEDIMKKFKRAMTDSENLVEYREFREGTLETPEVTAKEGINNLLTIFSSVTDRTIESIAKEYRDLGYAKFKNDVGEAVVEKFRPIRDNYNRYINDKAYLMSIAKDGAEKARKIAYKTLRKVHKKIGLIER